jgi:hypothetical protein
VFFRKNFEQIPDGFFDETEIVINRCWIKPRIEAEPCRMGEVMKGYQRLEAFLPAGAENRGIALERLMIKRRGSVSGCLPAGR